MSLDEELRATLGREAGWRSAPAPDVVGLIRAGRARRRRRSLVRTAAAIAASMVVGAATFGLMTYDPRADEEVVSPPTPAPIPQLPTRSDTRAPLEPGTYRMFVAPDRAGAKVEVDVSLAGPHWTQSDFPFVSDRSGAAHAGFGVYQPVALAAGNGCETGPTTGPVATTAGTLVAQLSQLPRSTVLRGPETARAAGRSAVHLRLRIDPDCPGYYRVAHAAGGTRGITYTPLGSEQSDVVIDFWVLEVDGVVVVVDEWHEVDASPGVVGQARAARRSITFVTPG